MRFLSTILALWVLLLAVAPCTDAHAEQGHEATTQVAEHHSDHAHAFGDLCTPFCTCNCCHTHVVLESSKAAARNTFQLPILSPPALSFTSQPPGPVFQPPKA